MALHDTFTRWLRPLLSSSSTSAVPAAPSSDASETTVVEEGEFVSRDTHFERYRRLIESFDEDRETPLEKVVRFLLLFLAYALPLIVAYAMGKEIGDAYGGRLDINDGWSLGTHVVAMAGELALTMMTFSAAAALRKMASDASYSSKFFGSVLAFLLFALASGLAQWFISSKHIAPKDTASLAALVFRVAMVPAVDVAALLFLAVMNFKSLKKFVADQRVRATAIRDINDAELEIQRAQSAAARRETEERQDMAMKEERNKVWLELDRLHAQTMIADAKRRAGTTVNEEHPSLDTVKVRRIERSGS